MNAERLYKLYKLGIDIPENIKNGFSLIESKLDNLYIENGRTDRTYYLKNSKIVFYINHNRANTLVFKYAGFWERLEETINSEHISGMVKLVVEKNLDFENVEAITSFVI